MSNFAAIGFDAPSREKLQAFLSEAFEQAEPPTDMGALADRYRLFRDPSGASLAIRLDAKGGVVCVTPFFTPAVGSSRWHVRSAKPHIDQECAHCSGADCDLLDPSSGELFTRATVQWSFFEPYRQWLESKRSYDLSVTGFASDLFLCSSEEEFEQAQAAFFGEGDSSSQRSPANPMRLSSQAFLPSGMFGNEGNVRARACAIVAGKVESVATPRNRLTGVEFKHVRIRTMNDTVVDVVAPGGDEPLAAKPILALAKVWLVGRPINPPPSTSGGGFWRRIIGKA